MPKLALVNLIICLLSYGTTMAQASKVDSSKMRTLRIDPSSSRGAAAAQVFDEIKFIPLETTKESLFGSINQLRVTPDRYIIWDYDTKSILIFTKEGKYIAKINGSKIEKDPDNKETQSFYGFTLKTENSQQLIQVSAGKYFFYFNLDGKLIKKVKKSDEEYIANLKFSDGTMVEEHFKDKEDKDSTNYEISLIKDKKAVEKYFPYSLERYKNDHFFSGGESITNYGVPDELFFINFYDYNIYRITPKKLYLAYKIIFPANNSLPSDFKENPIYKGKRQEYFEKNPKAFYAIGSTYQIGNNLYFKVNNWSWGSNEKKAFIYNLKSNAITSISDIEPDSLSQFLPVTDAGVHYAFSSSGFHLFHDKYFYTSYSSLLLFKFKEQSEGKNRKYDPVLTDFFKTQDKKSNPIIIQLKPKED